MPAVEVLVVGDANPDLLLTGDVVPRFGQAEQIVAAELALGGSGALTAAALVRLGVATALAAALGDDELGALTAARLAERGIDPCGLQRSRLPTGLSVHLLHGDDRTILTRTGAIDDLDVPAVRSLIAGLPGLRHVHVASIYLIGALARHGGELVAAAHAAGATVSRGHELRPGRRVRPAGVAARRRRAAAERDGGGPARRRARRRGARRRRRRGGRGGALRGRSRRGREARRGGGARRAGRRLPSGARGAPRRRSSTRSAPATRSTPASSAGTLDGRAPLAAAALACACGALSLRAAGDAGQPTLAEALAHEAGA